jgi:thiol-disulfide isomerase/thioredoxin
MKQLIATILVFLTFLSSSCGQKTTFSDTTLNSKLTDIDGEKIDFQEIIDKHKGKTLVIEIWASWCSDCVKAMPKIKELQANNTDVSYLFISMDKDFQKWKSGIEKHQIIGDHYWVNDPDLMKGSFGKSIDLDWIPRYIILDKNQKIITYRAIETDFELLNTTLKKLK